MNIIHKIIVHFKNPLKLKEFILYRFAPFIKNDATFLKLKWKLYMDTPLDLERPRTFSEKLQWLKLHNHRSEYSCMVDKAEAKKYAASIIGEEYINPTISVYDRVEDIDFNKLPQQFVLKCTHDSAGLVICRDKDKLDVVATKRKLTSSLKRNFFWQTREWPYKNVKPRIIAEPLLVEKQKPNSDLTDYKFYCFNGRAEYCQVIADRSTNETIDFYDRQWRHQPFVGLVSFAQNAPQAQNAPHNYSLMVDMADKIATDIRSPFVRIDFYNIDGRIYFGEVTFFPLSGRGLFRPQEWNDRLGDMIKIDAKA